MRNINGHDLPPVEQAAYLYFPHDGSSVSGYKRAGFLAGADWRDNMPDGKKESSPRTSEIAARVMRRIRQDRALLQEQGLDPAFLDDVQSLAGSVLSQDETKGNTRSGYATSDSDFDAD